MAELEADLPAAQFQRIHRSVIVNLARVRELREDEVVLADGRTLPLGRAHRGRLERALVIPR